MNESLSHYIALVHKEADSDFGVSFPDFPGCVSAGTTLDEAALNAREALELHVEGLLEDGEGIPEPSSVDDIKALPESAEAVLILVPAPAQPFRHIRVNVTLPDRVLSEIDRYAKAHGFSRSAFLVEASRRYLKEHTGR